MALAGRSSRSGGGRRLLIVVLLLTIVVVVIDASLKSRAPAPVQTLDGQMWVDRVLPVIADSTAQGEEIARIRANGLGLGAVSIRDELDRIAQSAKRDYQSVVTLRAPAGVSGASGLLQACLLVRSQAARSLAGAMVAALSGAPPTSSGDPNVAAVAAAGRDFQIADQAYKLFASNVPASLGVTVPPSTWVSDGSAYDPGALQVYLVALRNASSLAPVHQLTIQAVSTNPPPVGTAGSVQQIPPTKGIAITIVVADTGNQPEANLTVTATITPPAAGQASSVRDFMSLTPGTSKASTIGPLVPPSGSPSVLTVTVTPPPGSPTAAVTSTIQLEVAAPPPPSTTTTTSTTVPGSPTTTGSSSASSTTSTTGAG